MSPALRLQGKSRLNRGGTMVHKHLTDVFLACLVAVLFTALPSHSNGYYQPQIHIPTQDPIPNFPSPIDLETINHPDNPMNWSLMQHHAWELFLNLTTKPGNLPREALPVPLWENWYTKCDLDLSPNCDYSIVAGHNTFIGNSPQITETSTKRGGHFSTVYYSPSAGNWVQSKRLSQAQELQGILTGQLSNLHHGRADIPGLPPDSIVVKEIWAGFTGQDGLESIPVYDPIDRSYDDPTHSTLGHPANWPKMNLLKKNGAIDTETSCANNDYELTTAVPINCFYHIEFQNTCQAVMEKNVAMIHGTQPQAMATCYLVLVGVHIATKEITNWTWSTFWWTNKATARRKTDPADIQKAIPPQYSHYVMDTTFGPSNSLGRRSVYNPYLEGSTPNGMKSNCFDCHQNAAYDPRGVYNGGSFGQHNSGQGINAAGREVDEVTRVVIKSPPCVLRDVQGPCLLHTDFLWSIATNQDGFNQSPMLLLLKHHIQFPNPPGVLEIATPQPKSHAPVPK